MRKTNIIAGLIFFIGPLLLYKAKLEELKVQEYGKVVRMEIIDKPQSCFGTKVRWFMDVKYNGVIYSKRISANYCQDHNVGDIVELKYLEGHKFLLFPKQSVWGDIFAGLIISLSGLIIVIYYVFKRK